ncbi:uncharacterized protein ACHE_11452A [Aspergillus chevalieri]|uniref:Uncharacterized protein n=1 Tax=Aspergillus chevalieri TaxID=182096 RepID=A0A7R7ZIW9_ASPCH|nr:uncharacterized protein ACHE_11452A [Aspergillus chevalieri]BCR84050.1 hypothetical protein ACHE_11452A [Aspergillus chevalieri]
MRWDSEYKLLTGCLSAKSANKNGCRRPDDPVLHSSTKMNGQKAGRLVLSSPPEEENAMNLTSSTMGKSSQSASDKVGKHEKREKVSEFRSPRRNFRKGPRPVPIISIIRWTPWEYRL